MARLKYHSFIILIFLLITSYCAYGANDTILNNNQYERLLRENLWRYSSNPASLYEMNMPDFGKASLNFGKEGGHGHRPQEPETQQNLGFTTQRYQSLDKYSFSGDFSFKQIKETNRNFADVLNPYRNTPYVFATDNGGDWNKQHYELGASASTFPLWNWLNTGVNINYAVATGARENDPRPLNLMNNLRIAPGFLAHVSEKHKVGVNGYYERYKEEINIMIKTPNESFTRFQLLGLGEFTRGTMSSSYDRTYFGDTYGGNVQYIFKPDNFEWVTKIAIAERTEHVRDQISRPKKGGKYNETNFIGESHCLWNKPMSIHQVGFKGKYIEGKGTEFKQNFNRDTESWITFSQSVNYNLSVQFLEIYLKTMRKAPGRGYNYTASFSAAFQNIEKEYYLPNSFQHTTSLKTSAEFKKYFNHTWRVGFSFGYYKSLDNEIDLSETDDEIIQEEVAIPDYEYIIADKIRFKADISYYHNMPLQIRNALFNEWFVQAWGKRFEWTGKSFDLNQSGRFFFGVSLGIVY